MSTQYPNSVDSFPVHSDNTSEKIFAATINNIQDTLVALENRIGVAGLTQAPTPVPPADSLVVVNHQLFISNGTSLVAVGNSQVADTKDVQLTTTSSTNVLSFTPTANGNFVVYIYYRVVTSTTNVTIQVTYTDGTGAQTNTLLNAQSSAVNNSYSCVPLSINATTATPIVVKATSSIANQVYVSASIVGV